MLGRYQNAAAATRTAEIAAEMKKLRLMAAMPLRSPSRMRVTKMPMIAVSTPIIGTMSGKIRPSLAEGHLAQDEAGDQHDRVRLEQVGGHARAVADVVAHVVGDGRRVARVVLGDALLDLADQVGADVGGLGEDAAADSHEHREQRRAEAEAFEHAGRVALVDEDDDGRAEQAEADGEHAGHAAGAEGDAHGDASRRDSRAAAATRTFPRTASHMPMKPVRAENTAPTTKKIERPIAYVGLAR